MTPSGELSICWSDDLIKKEILLMTNKQYFLEEVSHRPELWASSDPVRPELDENFKTAPGRFVVGLRDELGSWKAFMCYARTCDVPKDIEDLETYTDEAGNIFVPYTVWSHEKGAGREIINQLHKMVCAADIGVTRIVTLSPLTYMARKFHLRNNAKEFRLNKETVNFEYEVSIGT